MAQPEITVDQITAAPAFDGTNITAVSKLASLNTFTAEQRITAASNPFIRMGPTSDSYSGIVGTVVVNAAGTTLWGMGHTPSVGTFYVARGPGDTNKVLSATNTAGELAITASDVTFEGASVINTTVVNFTSSRVIQLSDARKYLRMNHTSSRTFTVNTTLSSLATGTHIDLHRVSSGNVTVVAGGGVTINTPETLSLRKAHSSATLIKVGTNEWDLVGDLTFL
jgi:hypothetical protein